MKDAKSMYFAGEIISASECSYQSSRELGLICPFCSSAVFVRSESVRQVKGKLCLVRPYFAHYSSGVDDNWDCEKRSHSKQGLEHIEKLKTEARNQRLKLYNAYLWDMVAEDRNISHQMLNKVRSVFGEKWCESQSIKVRKELASSIDSVYTFIDAALLEIDSARAFDKNNNMFSWMNKETFEEEAEVQQEYFQTCDRRLHRAICYEIAEFLATNTGGFAFLKLFKACLLLESVCLDSLSKVKQMEPRSHLFSIAGFLCGTHWTEQINKRS